MYHAWKISQYTCRIGNYKYPSPHHGPTGEDPYPAEGEPGCESQVRENC